MLIEFNNLTLQFPNRLIFKDFSAIIKAGEFIGVFGPNGAGKSTLLRAILGLEKIAGGAINIESNSAEIGYLPQIMQNLTNNNLTGREYIKSVVNGFRFGLPIFKKQKEEDVNRVIKLVNAETYIDRPISQFSGGERKRIMLAEALLNQPKILLLDEPLSGLDPGQQSKMIDLIKTLQNQLNITVLFTAHDINPLLGSLDRIIYLAAGKAAIGEVGEIVTSEKLSWLYGAPIEVVTVEQRLFVIHKQYGSDFHDTSHVHDH